MKSHNGHTRPKGNGQLWIEVHMRSSETIDCLMQNNLLLLFEPSIDVELRYPHDRKAGRLRRQLLRAEIENVKFLGVIGREKR